MFFLLKMAGSRLRKFNVVHELLETHKFRVSRTALGQKADIANSAWVEAYNTLFESYITTLGHCVGVQS